MYKSRLPKWENDLVRITGSDANKKKYKNKSPNSTDGSNELFFTIKTDYPARKETNDPIKSDLMKLDKTPGEHTTNKEITPQTAPLSPQIEVYRLEDLSNGVKAPIFTGTREEYELFEYKRLKNQSYNVDNWNELK